MINKLQYKLLITPFIFLALKYFSLRLFQQKLRSGKTHSRYRKRLTHTHAHTSLTCPKCRRTIWDVLTVFHFSTAFGSFLDASVDFPSVFTKGPSFQYLSLSLFLVLSPLQSRLLGAEAVRNVVPFNHVLTVTYLFLAKVMATISFLE